MGLAGRMMLRIERWLGEEKLYGITGGNILLSVGFLAVMVGIVIGIRFERSRNDKFWLNKDQYQMVGVAQMPGEKSVYLPVYRRMK